MPLLQFSSVPGMAVPGTAVPALAGTGGSAGPFLYLGHVPAFYLDYLDSTTQETLSVVPGSFYSMTPVNSRAGLTVPPPDNCWPSAGNQFAPRFGLRRQAVPEAQPPPEVFALDALFKATDMLARARIRNANLQALMAQGVTAGGD